MQRSITLLLLALVGLATACKQSQEIVPVPTSFSFDVVYEQTGLPVDSAIVEIIGVKGGVLNPPMAVTSFFKGYTDASGRLSGRIEIPNDNAATFSCYKPILAGNKLIVYDVLRAYPSGLNIKKGQENKISIELSPLP